MAKSLNKRWIRILVGGGAVAVMMIATYLLFGTTLGSSPEYQFVTLTQGNLVVVVSGTGTLSPVTFVFSAALHPIEALRYE